MSINKYRKRIDEIDEKINALLEERFSISKAIGLHKFKKQLPIQDLKREEEILSKIDGAFQNEKRAIYQLIFEKSRNLQKFEHFLVGGNLAYTFSPLIYRLFGLYDYALLETDDFSKALKHEFKGINITNPHKLAAYKACTRVSEIAKRSEAVNIIIKEEDDLFGDNTDYYGFNALLDYYGFNPKDKKILIIGRGATAKLVALVLKDRGAKKLTYLVRNLRSNNEVLISDYQQVTDYDFLINATPYGTYPNIKLEPLFPLKDFKNLEAAIDLNYNPHLTPLVREARKHGIPSADGLYMLVAQAYRNISYFLGENKVDLLEVYKKLNIYRANIVLIGMPYSGKSVLGEKLSRIFEKEFVDIDRKLEAEGKDIHSLLPKGGIKLFRSAEAEATISYSKGWNQIIACGGGIVLNSKAMAHLQSNGVIVFLDEKPEKLVSRIDGTRPLIRNAEDLYQTYNERIDLYRKYADITIQEETDIRKITERIYEYFSN